MGYRERRKTRRADRTLRQRTGQTTHFRCFISHRLTLLAIYTRRYRVVSVLCAGMWAHITSGFEHHSLSSRADERGFALLNAGTVLGTPYRYSTGARRQVEQNCSCW